MSRQPPQVAVYIDWQNTYKAARVAFGLEAMPNEYGNFSPYRLARILARGNGRGESVDLVRLEIHRGLPSSTRDPIGYGANRRQAAAWMKENPEIVIPRLRPLRYPRDPQEPPVEKGIDVQLGVAALEHVLTGRCDVAIIFSHDTDLLPVVEALVRLRGAPCVETAAWTSPSFMSRLRPRTGPRVFHHEITEEIFNGIATPINFAYRGI
ncbi:MAG: NYN domain-containing protein [Gaiellaceae bacterium]